MSWWHISTSVLNAIKSYLTSSTGKQTLDWVAKNNPAIAKAIRDGLGISDAVTAAQQLDASYNRIYAKILPLAKKDEAKIERALTKLNNAKQKVTDLENKIKGNKANTMSKGRLGMIKADIIYAKSIVAHLQTVFDDAVNVALNNATNLSNSAMDVKTKYDAVKKLI